jgi:RNase H-fold protein (predicted Holliday junction resolvase)
MFDVLAIDWGTIRSGLAFGSSSTFLVLSYTKELPTSQLFEVLDLEIKEKKPNTILVGLPSNFKREKTATSLKIEDFCNELTLRYPKLKLITLNENGTSKISKLKAQGTKGQNKQESKHQINHLSAKALCESYFDSIK